MRSAAWPGVPGLAVLGTLIVIGAVGMGRVNPAPSPLASLLTSEDPGFLDLTLVFRPLDCQLPIEIIEELNELASAEAVTVRGIMIGPLPKGDDLDVLLRGLGVTFPVVEDADGYWSDALIRESIPNPTLFIYKRGLRYASISLEGLQTLKRYLPRTARTVGG
ncbi:MAG: hypothetical protein F4X47_03040 [Gammaproteobacteria bacterium]|nr:hypothetical protein [Gammaproteobacteria bacterium]MYC51275.1 hypothetical protein [Gammaproteobacteria bacterium]